MTRQSKHEPSPDEPVSLFKKWAKLHPLPTLFSVWYLYLFHADVSVLLPNHGEAIGVELWEDACGPQHMQHFTVDEAKGSLANKIFIGYSSVQLLLRMFRLLLSCKNT